MVLKNWNSQANPHGTFRSATVILSEAKDLLFFPIENKADSSPRQRAAGLRMTRSGGCGFFQQPAILSEMSPV
jgi:hypothetical protein